jgi:O-antigen/teichoic acid export membrane protein
MNFSREIFLALFKSGAGTVGKIAFNAVALKLIALTMGPYGVGLFAQIRQLWQTSVTIGSINSGTAVIQGVSSKSDVEKIAYVNSIFWLVTIVNISVSLLVYYLSGDISKYFLNDNSFNNQLVIERLSLASFFGVYLIFFSSILNGYHAIGYYSLVTTTSAFFLMALSWPILTYTNNPAENLILMLIISELLALLICILLVIKKKMLCISWHINSLNFGFIKDFFKTSSALLVTGLVSMIGLLWIRTLIIETYGLYGAGIFDAAWLFCMTYVLIITKSFGAYFLPKLSCTLDSNQRNLLINEGVRVVILIATPLIVAMISFKPMIITLLYTNEFNESLQIMQWMLIADFFKIISWLLAFTMIAFKDVRAFFWSEVVFSGLLLLGMYFSIVWVGGYEGIGKTFLIVSFSYMIYTIIYNQIKNRIRLDDIMFLMMGMAVAIIAFSSFNTWGESVINYKISIFNVVMSTIFSWFLLNKKERNKVVQFLGL